MLNLLGYTLPLERVTVCMVPLGRRMLAFTIETGLLSFTVTPISMAVLKLNLELSAGDTFVTFGGVLSAAATLTVKLMKNELLMLLRVSLATILTPCVSSAIADTL